MATDQTPRRPYRTPRLTAYGSRAEVLDYMTRYENPRALHIAITAPRVRHLHWLDRMASDAEQSDVK
jgi:hypothetical protein